MPTHSSYEEKVVVAIGIVLLIIVAVCILQMIKSYIGLKRLEKQNPVVENEVVRDFVYTKPEKITHGTVFDVIGVVNIVNAAKGEYELLVRQNYGGAKLLHQRLASFDGMVMLLQQPFNARYMKEAVINENNYYVFLLERIEGASSPLLISIEPNIERRMHLLVI